MQQSTLKAVSGIDATIRVKTRDLGYGVEERVLVGFFTGEVDVWGKWTFETDRGETHYLFADEVRSIEQ